MSLRPDLSIISEWIKPGSRVLDLGCGDGALLAHLHADRNVTGYGLEIDDDNVRQCIAAGVNDDGIALVPIASTQVCGIE